jgi:hypothetical protein
MQKAAVFPINQLEQLTHGERKARTVFRNGHWARVDSRKNRNPKPGDFANI